jgi:predicted DNA-binding ribbon-helix-helix protein
MMAAAKREMPLGGKRAKMGTGRARGRLLGVWLDDAHFQKIAELAEAEGITRTALIERWIDEHSTPLPEGNQSPE